MQAIGYVRVSTQGQADDGVSLDMQRSKIAAWADLHDAELLNVYADEGISGMKSDREGLVAALAAAEQHGAALVVYSISRLSRSTIDLLGTSERLDKAGCDLVSLSEQIDTSTAAGRMVFRMLSTMAEFERDLISERTKAAMGHKKAKLERVGNIPHGYQLASDGVHLVPVEREQEIKRLAAELREKGLTLRQISDELAEIGAFNRAGRPFNPKSVASMLKAA
jgi:DNA invertase Pin-like site-specific DNA recombinase